MIGIKKERKLEENQKSELSYRSSNSDSKRRVVRGLNARSFSVLEQTATEIRSFLGLAGYYRRFIQDFSRIAAPMTRLTQKGVKFVWSDRCEDSL